MTVITARPPLRPDLNTRPSSRSADVTNHRRRGGSSSSPTMGYSDPRYFVSIPKALFLKSSSGHVPCHYPFVPYVSVAEIAMSPCRFKGV